MAHLRTGELFTAGLSTEVLAHVFIRNYCPTPLAMSRQTTWVLSRNNGQQGADSRGQQSRHRSFLNRGQLVNYISKK